MSNLSDLLKDTNDNIVKGYAFRTNDNGETFKLLKLDAITTEEGTEDELVATIYGMDSFMHFLAEECKSERKKS